MDAIKVNKSKMDGKTDPFRRKDKDLSADEALSVNSPDAENADCADWDDLPELLIP
jgi:hypothetical protein